ncbi:MAG TPA: hypothetical protein VFM63_15990, partial [Pyrinomonadaceae bacterium]|nr:hypothetical protein [Pyrinomonadaceae bacterium]
WSWQSFNYQEEHNYFSDKAWFFQWFANQFNRKWDSPSEYEPFAPQPPSAPANFAPANGSTAGQSVLLTWEGGRWAHQYDVYLGPGEHNLSLIASNVITGTLGTNGSESYLVSGLQNDVTYCWRIAGKTMANQTALGPTWCFRTSATAALPLAPMQLILDSTGPAADQIAAVDSMFFARDPFPIVNPTAVLNPGNDRNTRVVVFVRNLQLAQDEPAASVVVNLVDEKGAGVDVPAEVVTAVSNTDFVQVTFRLPDGLAGICTVKIKAHGQVSNAGRMRISL